MSSEARKLQKDPSWKVAEPPDNPDMHHGSDSIQELKAKLRAQELLHAESLEQLGYALMHDLSELLRMVRGYVQLQARREQNQQEEGREFATYIQDRAQRMEQMLGDLVVYSHQFRPREAPLAPADSEGVLEGVLLNLGDLIRKTQANVTHGPLPKVLCDPAQLGHLFRHLIVNALTFRGEQPPRVDISAAEQPNQMALFSVSDNGLGIEPRYHEQIFMIFKRLHGREYPGNGLGLPICKRIVEQKGGRIWVESTPGQGSMFRFTLPRGE